MQDGIERASREYSADPIAKALMDLALRFDQSAPTQRTVVVDLPRDVGGRRELDATQIGLIIGRLNGHYRFYPPETVGSQPHVAVLARMEAQISAHNRRIEGLGRIVEALQRAR